MTEKAVPSRHHVLAPKAAGKPRPTVIRRTLLIAGASGVALLFALASAWLGAKASTIRSELSQAAALIPEIKNEVIDNKGDEARDSADRFGAHTARAREASEDPLWTLASAAPVVGPNFAAISEIARSADDVAALGLIPLVDVFNSLSWDAVIPTGTGADLESIQRAAPKVASAAHAVRISADRLSAIEDANLLPQVAEPLNKSLDELRSVSGALNASADAAHLVTPMLGAEGPRNYLLMIQNSAEVRASGGIPGALAVLAVDRGKIALVDQSSASELGVMSPIVNVDPRQHQIYTGRLGKFMQDVNLTPDFPTAASTALSMWERRKGQRLDGVISIDPIALSYILEATGPIRISNPDIAPSSEGSLPSELDSSNVVSTLLSDVYARIELPQLQDAYFAGVAQEVFATLSNGKANAKGLMEGVSRAASEGRVLISSARQDEQSVIARYPMGGAIAGPNVGAAQFGVYFNDGTGAKMDYYVKRTVQLVKECPKDGYEQTTVRVTNTNTAPADAATSLPPYVTGDGKFGVPPGSVQTNIAVYGPVQADVETARVDGQPSGFAPYLHSNRPVGVLAVRLAPGESRTVDFTFGKIVQQTEPNVVVTPTVQAVEEVTLPTANASCS